MKPRRIFNAARLSFPLATALAFALSVKTSNAASVYWDANGTAAGAGATPTGTWGTDPYWNATLAGDTTAPIAWVSGDTAVFSAGADAINAYTVTLNGAQTIGGLTVEEGTPTISGAGSLVLNNAATPFAITGTATISSAISGATFGIAKSGAGTLNLTVANSYDGKTSVTGGILAIALDTALGTAPVAPVADQLTLNNGTLKVTATGQTLNVNRGVTLVSPGGTFEFTDRANTETFTIAGAITGTGALTLKSSGGVAPTGGGAGLGINLTNIANDYVGDTTITSGLVTYASNAVFGNTANKIILNGGGLLDNSPSLGIALARNIEVLAGGGTFRTYGGVTTANWSGAITGSGFINRVDGGTLTLSGDLSGYAGTYNNQGGNTTLTGTAATIGGNWTISAGTLTVNSTADQALAGNLTGAGAFAKNAAGILTLSGSNNHTGATTITAGTLRQSVANAVSLGGALTVNGTSVFDLNSFNASVGSLAGVSTGIVRDDAAGSGTTTLSLTAAAASSAVNIKDGATRTLALRVTNATGAFALTNGANNFSGGIVLTNGAGGTRMSPGSITAGAYGTGAITVGESATDLAGIYFATATQTLTNPIVSNTNLGNDRVGTFRVDATGIVLSGQLTANLAPMTFSTNATGAISATGKITGSSGLMLLSRSFGTTNGVLTVTLNNAADNNDYAGDTIIHQEPLAGRSYTLALGRANQIPNGAGKGNVIINTNGTGIGSLNLGGFSETINGLSGNGTVDGVSGSPTLTVGDNNATATFSGILKNAAGALALTKTGTGTQTLSGASTFSGGTTVSNGTLIASGSTSLGTNSGVTVANGATFAYQPTAAGPLSLGTGVLNFASGSRVRAALGGTVGQSAITSSGAAVTVAGPVTLDVFVIPGAAPAAGTHNLITAGSGLNNATYSIGSVFNAANYTLSGLTQSATAVSITTAAATPLTTNYWKGGFSDGNNIWAISNGSSASNWASDASGTDTSLTPGSTSTVIFSATGATNQGDMILGANMSIAGMVVNDTNAIVLNTNANGFALTLGTGGMQINSGAGAVTIAAPVILGTAQSWINDGSSPLTLAGTIGNGGFAHTLGGSGPISLSGTVSGTGALTKTGAGALTISSAQTYTGLTSLLGGNTSLTNSNALATTTVEPNGGTLDFGALTAASLGGLQGSQNLSLLNLSSAPITLTVGGNNSTTTYSGTLSGSGSSFYKTGAGTMTIAGAASNSYTGTTTVDNGTLILGKTGGVVAISGPVTMGGLNANQPNLRMAANNQFAPGVVMTFVNAVNNWARFDLQGTTQTLTGIQNTTGGGIVQNERNGGGGTTGPATLTINNTSDYSFNGYMRDRDGGDGTWLLNLIKTGSGTQTLAGGQIRHTGTTTVSNGTLKLLNTTVFKSPIVNSSIVEFEATSGGVTAGAISGAGTYNKTNTGIFQFNGGQEITATGQFNIQQGTLQNGNNAVNWTGNKADIDVSSGAILDLFADAIYLDVLTGSGIVQNNYGNTTGQSGSAAFIEKLVLGTNDGNGTFAGVIRNNVTNATLAANTGFGGLQLEKVGTGTQILTGTNLYTGSTTVTGGTLQLDFATGGTINILAPTSALVLAGGTLEIKGGSGEFNSQTFGGISGTGKIQLTQNGATSINVSLGAVNVAGGLINFAGSDATVAALGNLNFLTSTTTTNNDGSTRLGPHLWNGTDWASTSAIGGNHVVKWLGTYVNLTTNGNDTSNPTGELRIIDGATAGTAATFSASTTAESLLNVAPTYATTVDLGSNTLTVGNAAGATGAVGMAVGAQALTIGATPGQGFLTAGTSAAASILALNNQSSSALTVNSVISNNAVTGVVSLTSSGNTTLNAVNTFAGSTTITAGTLTIGGAGALGTGTYAGTIANSGSFVFASSAATQTLSGAISGTGALAMNGSGTLTLSGPNTYTGTTAVNVGTLKLGNAAALGSTAVGTTVGSGATLDLNGLVLGTLDEAITISGTGVGGTAGAISNSSTTKAVIKKVTLAGDTTLSPGTGAISIGSSSGQTGTMNLNGYTLTKSGTGTLVLNGVNMTGAGNITVAQGTLQLMEDYNNATYPQVATTLAGSGNLTINSGATVTTYRWSPTLILSMPIILNGGTLGSGWPGPNGATIASPISVTANSFLNFGGGYGNVTFSGALSGASDLTRNGGDTTTFSGDLSGYGGTLTLSAAITSFSGVADQVFNGNIAGTATFQKAGTTTTSINGIVSGSVATSVNAGTLVLKGANLATGTTVVNSGGTLKLDYGTNNNRKIGSGVLTLSGGSIELVGLGSTFADSVASTTLTASTSSNITQTSGAATLNLGAITANSGSFLNFGQSGIARTINTNNANGILGTWATIGGSQYAMNDGTGLIVAATTTDLTRLSSGSKEIADGSINHVRFIEGTGTAGNFTLGSAVTTINTMTQSSVGGATAATVDLALQTLALNSVSVGTGAGALTIGTASNNGTLKAAGAAIEFRDLAAAGITVNSIIANGTGATTITKTDPGTLTFSGTNSYTGGTIVNAGTLTASLGTTAGVRFPFGSGAITANSGTTLRFFAGGTPNAMSYSNAINLNAATLTSEDANQTYAGNIALTGANTVNVTYSDKSATFSGIVSGGGSLTKASAGVLTLSNANSYTGGTTLSAGTLKTANTAALGAAGQALTLNGGTLQLASDTTLSSKNLTVGGSSTITLDRASTGVGLATSFGNLTFGSNFTLTVNKGANAISGISTLNFTGFPALGAASTTTNFAIGADAEVNISGSLTGTQAFANVAKSGAGRLILSGNNNYWDPTAGLITVSGGTLDLRSQNAMGDGTTGANSIALSMAASTTLRLGTNTSLGNYADLTLTGTGATILSDRASGGAGITNQFDVLSIGAFTLNVNGGSNVTSGTTQVNFNTATLTGNATLNVVNPAAGATNVLVSGVVGGAFSLTKTGSGTLTLQGANTYNTTTAISGGTLNLSGLNGAIASSTGITLSTGGILTLANTSTANNGNRIAGTLAMNGGTLNFTNNQGTVNYAETTGALSIGGGANTIATGQAAVGQTSILTFPSLARTAGTLNFTGTGLGTTVDTKNEIRFTTNPTLVNGIIGTWATVNGTDYATTTGANNSVVAYSAYTDVTRKTGIAPETGVIPNTSAANVRIIEGTGATLAPLTLAAATTTINTLNQSTFGGTSAASIDPNSQTLVVNSVLVSSGSGGLTIGTGINNGTLKSAGTALVLINASTNASTINSVIADGTALSTLTKGGSGTFSLTGVNTFTGGITIGAGTLQLGGAGTISALASAAAISNNGVLQLSSSAAQTITGVISGTGSVMKDGAGNVVLGSATFAGSTFSGGMAVTNGLVTIQGNNNGFSVAGSGTLTIGTGATVRALSANALGQGGGTLTPLFVNGGTFEGDPYNHINTVAMTGGTIAIRPSATAVDGLDCKVFGGVNPNITTNAAAGSATISLKISNSSGPMTATVADGAAATDLLVSGVIAGTSQLIKAGPGLMQLSAANTFSGALTVNAGRVNVSSTLLNVPSFYAGTGATLEFGATNIFVAGHGVAMADSRVITVDGGTLLFNANADFRFGNVTLNNGATWTSNRVLTNYDALLANTSAGAATVRVTGNAASTMNGTGGIHLQGIQNFDVADVTASSATDLTVSMILGAQGTTGGAAGGINKTGAGTMTLTSANAYTGATTVSAGTLELVGGSQASPITVSAGASLGFTLGLPTTSTSTFDMTAGTIKITGTPTLPSYTLITSSTGIIGTPTLDAPIAGYTLTKYGNVLKLETPAGMYESWATATGATGGTGGNPDDDGLTNLQEYAFGTNPTASTGEIVYSGGTLTTPGAPKLVYAGGAYSMVFGRRADYVAAGLTYTVQFSAGLDAWVDNNDTNNPPAQIATDGTINVMSVPFVDFITTPSGTRKPTFSQVKVELAP